MCGKCCSYEIPITILDIYRIAEGRGISNKEAFSNYIQKEISVDSGIFMISKKKNAECIFLMDNKCLIHDYEPNICSFYFCEIPTNSESKKWTQQYSHDKKQTEKIWEQSVAIAITKEYVKKNSSNWNENDFYSSLSSILNNIKNRDSQELKLSSSSEGSPICLIYDCKLCDKHGKLATETIITIDDARRIISYLNISWELFFKSYVDAKLTDNNLLQLKRNQHCIFHMNNSDCLINSVKPNHCLYTTCPSKCESNKNNNYDRFYLGSGTIEDQYRHQISLTYTKEYAASNGSSYNETEMNKFLNQIDKTVKNKINYTEFCEQISEFRYIKPQN